MRSGNVAKGIVLDRKGDALPNSQKEACTERLVRVLHSFVLARGARSFRAKNW